MLRRIHAEGWQFSRTDFDLDNRGVGTAIYRTETPQRTYSLVVFAHDLPPEQRSNRVIAESWDATFNLFDGIPNPDGHH
ncbi:MAG: hypothetical protein HRT36_08120 [Alphaproteobacteria bacterium]|nr:hypothetical protein [Alphaproteobacteria bacterium]